MLVRCAGVRGDLLALTLSLSLLLMMTLLFFFCPLDESKWVCVLRFNFFSGGAGINALFFHPFF